MSHFYEVSYRVVDPNHSVRWIIDAGANIGDETTKFRAFNPVAQVIAIEPDPATAAVLRQNAAGDPNIHVEEKALWSRAGCTLGLLRADNPEVSTVTTDISNTEVETTSFDDLRKRYGIERFDVVKLDIEGAESELLKDGNTEWLARTDVVIMEVADHQNPGGLQRLLGAIPHEVDCRIVGESVTIVRRGSGLWVERYVLA
jgi:FkbM family methyltransferase